MNPGAAQGGAEASLEAQLAEVRQAVRILVAERNERQGQEEPVQRNDNWVFRRSLSSAPKYTGDRPFREFLLEFTTFLAVFEINEDAKRKAALLFCITGKAAERMRSLSAETASFKDLSYLEYSQRVKQLFQPDSERLVARSEFVRYSQTKTQDVASYTEMKFGLWEAAFEESERSFDTLYLSTLRGLYNPVVRRLVRRKNPATQEELRRSILEVTSIERESFLEGYGESSSLDGLSSVTFTRTSLGASPDQPEPMEIDSLQDKKKLVCYRCGKNGHKIADCRVKVKGPKKEESKKKVVASQLKCYSCGEMGHMKRYCKSLKKAIPGKKPAQLNEIEEFQEEDYFLGLRGSQDPKH